MSLVLSVLAPGYPAVDGGKHAVESVPHYPKNTIGTVLPLMVALIGALAAGAGAGAGGGGQPTATTALMAAWICAIPVARLARTRLVPINVSTTASTVFAVGTNALIVLHANLSPATTPACTRWIKPVMSVTAVAMLVEHDAVPPMPAPTIAAAVPRSRVLRRVVCIVASCVIAQRR